VIGAGGRDLRVEPSLSGARVLQWLHELRHFRYDETTSLGQKIAKWSPTTPSRSLVIVLSDLHDPMAVPVLKPLAQKHDCVVLHLQDPAERGLRGAGFLRAREAETGRAFVTRGGRQWLDPLLSLELRRAGIDYLRIATDEMFVPRLRNFFKSRNLLGRGAR
jgi:uncharacterized protein (DUF58 family)